MLGAFLFQLVAMTSIYMAGKIEEEELKIRNVINVCYRTFYHDRPPLELDDTFWALRQSIIQTELVIVRVLSFHLVFNHPHKVIIQRGEWWWRNERGSIFCSRLSTC